LREYLIIGERIGLSPVLPEDEPFVYDLWRDPMVQRNLNFRAPDESFDDWLRAEAERPSWLRCATLSITDETFVGFLSLGVAASDPELIVLLRSEWQGKGFGTEAARLIVDYGFGCMGLTKIGGGAFEFNLASQRMLEKIGFVRRPKTDGRYENAWGPGEVVELDYVLSRDRWEILRRAG